MPEVGACSRCGGPLGAGFAADGTCLACLLAQGLPDEERQPARRPGSLAAFLRVVNVLADGPRARAYLAEWVSPDGGFAVVKRSHGTAPADPRRAQAVVPLLELDHPHVATVFDVGRDAEGHAYVITEYVPGTPLREYWRRSDLARAERLELVRQVADTLAYLHGRRMMHANLKPSNVLVLDPPAGVRLLDLDAAMPRESPGGHGSAAFDPEPDVRGLGALLSTVLEAGGSDPGADLELRRISRKAVATAARERYQTIHEMATDIARCLAVAAGS